ncbi:Uncharacterized conserved protein, DUF305 family [Thermomonospora echinospora]|uniref:Uncharacterized conserved protein, DUF305 family n=1 Tax=Thermomonospora echinospora TaxID=1992 RepID=A0A1H6DVL5_9ACTN|nr:DUF305 domain-containing protein [Thermomonospora echinospora]SEG89321.1 Uncharacterized conserved protein, DUF305 family [Thermomonospora echinospora]
MTEATEAAAATQATAAAPPRGRRVSLVLAALVAVVAVIVVAVSVLRPGGPGPDSPEAGFARDMSTHHAQAVRMSFLVRDATEDEAVRLLAYDIINTQSAQIGMMTAWLDQWEAPKVDPGGSMRWMSGHGGHGGGPAATMPGMATREQLEELENAEGRAAEVLFLKLMIAHHRGGVSMAEAILSRTDHKQVERLARTMVQGQRSEVDLMNTMLRERGAA